MIVEDLKELPSALELPGPLTLLGEGTNVVLPARLRGRVVCLNLRSIEMTPKGKGIWSIRAGAAVNWHELVRFTLGSGINGLENLALIPGSVGAAPYQNIGAYGCEISDYLTQVEAFDRDTFAYVRLTCDECQFGYRDSLFKSIEPDRYIITVVELELGQQPKVTHYPDIKKAVARFPQKTLFATRIAEEVIRVRRGKLPDHRFIGNVGSFFENPIVSADLLERLRCQMDLPAFPAEGGYKIPAARLIDVAGWKGKTYKSAQVWPQQPLVLVNLGSSTSVEVLELARQITTDIFERFSVQLAIEPTIIESE